MSKYQLTMETWQRLKKTAPFLQMAHRTLLIILALFSLLTVPCSLLFAESEFSLDLAPVLEVPVGLSQFNPGMGAAASFDWAFWSPMKNGNMGFFAGLNFANIPVQTGDPLTLFDGRTGPFFRWQPFERWAFRAGLGIGVYQYSRGETNNTQFMASFNAGAEFRLSPYFSLFAGGGYNYRIFSPSQPLSTMSAALGLRFNLSEIMGGSDSSARVLVEKTGQYRVFPVSWAWYEQNPVATVKITNEEPNTITDINLTLFMDSFMGQPWVFASLPRLAPGESMELPVTALFNEVMLDLIENTNAGGSIQINYRSLGARKEGAFAVQMPIFHRNSFSWEDDRRAAAFVSPRDASARHFARYVAGVVESQGQTGNVPGNVRYAAAMFEALRLYGISYVVVPATSYKNLSGNEAELDNVSYPYQALYYRGGDCTYLSILYCSLLEVLDIQTAFITIPGHLYLAFEVGDSSWLPNNSDIIELDGKRWLPVEITVPGEGFTRAWRIGAREWRNSGSEAQLHPIRECWELYPPVTVPASGDHLPEVPSRDDILKALEAELQTISR